MGEADTPAPTPEGPLAGRSFRLVAVAERPDWEPGLIAQLRAAGAAVVSTTEVVRTSSAHVDVLLAVDVESAAALRAAGWDRFQVWTVVQTDPGTPLMPRGLSAAGVGRAVAESRRVVVFDEASRSAVESTLWNAAGKVVVMPRFTAEEVEAVSFGGNRVEGPHEPGEAILVLHAGLLGSEGAHVLREYSDAVRARRHVRKVLVVAPGDLRVAVRSEAGQRHLARIPGASLIDGGAELSRAAAGRRTVTVLPRWSTPQDSRAEDLLAWAAAVGAQVWAEPGAVPPQVSGRPVGQLPGDNLSAALDWADQHAGGTTFGAAPINRVAQAFAPHVPALSTVPAHPNAPLKVLFVGADYKFAGDLVEALILRPDAEVRVDQWKTNGDRPTPNSAELLAWADVVICEFASRNAVWASQHIREHQRLIVHLHGYELRNPLIHDIVMDRVHTVVFASEFYRADAVVTTGWRVEQTAVIPNSVQSAELRRPKTADARFHLGLAGYVPELKRMDRALDLLEELVRRDDRFVLHLRGRHPWNYPYVWRHPLRRDTYLANYERLRSDPRLRRAVVFDDFGPDMGNWFRNIGWMLSPSTRETFHLAPAEGMASGAVPVVWRREGSDEIFPPESLVTDAASAADRIHRTAGDRDAYDSAARSAIEFATRYEAGAVVDHWLRLILHGERPGGPPSPEHLQRARPVATALAGRADWNRVGRLLRDGRVEQAAAVAQEESRPAWAQPEDVRRLAAHVNGYSALAQRAHRLVPSAPCVPPLLPLAAGADSARSLTLTEGPAGTYVTRSGDIAVGRGDILDDVNAEFDRLVDQAFRIGAQNRATALTVIGDEMLALAGGAVAGWLGIPFVWDLTSEPAARDLLMRMRALPDAPTPQGRLALLAAASATRLIGAGPAERLPVPFETFIGMADLDRPRRVGVIGRSLGDLVGRSWGEPVNLSLGRWREQTVPRLDVALLDAQVLHPRNAWRASEGNTGPLGAFITHARRHATPLAIVDLGHEGLDSAGIAQARRVDAVVTAHPDDVQRLHDVRIVPSQVAVSTAPWGVRSGEEHVLRPGDRVRLAMRMLGVAETR